MKKFLPYLILLSSLVLASCAAYYSIFGLAKLYAGAAFAVILMGSAIEFAKLVAASALQQFKKKLGVLIRIYLTLAIIIAMIITSAGIYGFLTNAYQKTANSIELVNNEISLLNGKRILYDNSIVKIQSQIDNKNKRVEQLSNLRNIQEVRLDSLYARKSYTTAKRTEAIIIDADKQISRLNSENDSLLHCIQINQDSINNINTSILEKNSTSIVANEIGPLKYLGELTGVPLNKIINWFTIMLVLVFDPLAIILIISFNKIMFKEELPVQPIPIEDLIKPIMVPEVAVPSPEIKVEPIVQQPVQTLHKETPPTPQQPQQPKRIG